MKLLDILTAPWAIEPNKLLEIKGIYATHLRGEKIDIEAVEKKLGRPLASEPQAYQVQDGVAVLPIEGVISKRMNMFAQISGGTSSQLLARDLQAAQADPAVHSIILAIDSPGGTVDGTQTLADLIATSSKPTVAWASGCMASAAYWIGSAAQAIYIADSTTTVGSIGVVATHQDVSAAEATAGVKTTEIYAGAYKRIASSYAPLSDAGRQSMQDQVDYTYGLFVEAVAKQRGVSTDTVLKNMADGRIFIGQQAVDAGLVDGVSTLDALVQQLNTNRASGTAVTVRAGVAQPRPILSTPKKGLAMLTADQVAADHPQAATALRAEGATAERTRIAGIEAQAIPGHEKLIAALKADGTSTAGDAAMAVLAAEKQSRHAAATALANDAPKPVPTAAAPSAAADAPPKDIGKGGFISNTTDTTALNAAAKQYQAKNPAASYIDAIKAVQQGA